MAIELTVGNIFECDADVLVNPVNCVGISGAGLAKKFKQKFPDAQKHYEYQCRIKRLCLGNPVWSNNQKPEIILFPTKDHWRSKSQLSDVSDGLLAMRRMLISREHLLTIAIPALGCGLGGLNFFDVKREVEKAFVDLQHKIILFVPK